MRTELVIADYQDGKHQHDLVELLNAYAVDPMGGGEPLSEFTRDNLCRELAARPHIFTILCYVDDQPAGLCNCVEGFSTFKSKPLINIHDIAVAPGYRGQGLSHKMLQKTEQIARDRGCCKLTLEVLSGNAIARKSYQAFGFNAYELDPASGTAMFWEKALQ
jgi:ribosomal protein S18 acetylase RimI-like enzyme